MVISEKSKKDFEKFSQNEREKNKLVRIYNPIDTEEILSKSSPKSKSDDGSWMMEDDKIIRN